MTLRKNFSKISERWRRCFASDVANWATFLPSQTWRHLVTNDSNLQSGHSVSRTRLRDDWDDRPSRRRSGATSRPCLSRCAAVSPLARGGRRPSTTAWRGRRSLWHRAFFGDVWWSFLYCYRRFRTLPRFRNYLFLRQGRNAPVGLSRRAVICATPWRLRRTPCWSWEPWTRKIKKFTLSRKGGSGIKNIVFAVVVVTEKT